MQAGKYPSQEVIRHYLYYQDGVLIRNSRDRREFDSAGKWKKWNNLYAGTVAGSLSTNGYVYIRLNGLRYMAHRLVWIYHNGDIPSENFLDHINHQRSDNKIENLRLVTQKENGRNQSLHKTNTSGVAGVVLEKRPNRWVAQIFFDGKYRKLGYFSDFNEAVAARKSAEILYGFHQNHGS